MNRRGAATRECILDASRELLRAEGVAALSLRRIASEAGLSLGNLQHHFAGLSALLEALLARELSAHLEQSAAALTEACQGEFSAVVVEVVLASQHEEGAQLLVAFWALAAVNPSLRLVLRGFYKSWVERLTGALQVSEPSLRPAEAQQRAALFVACTEGLALFRAGVAAAPNPHFTLSARGLLTSILEGRTR